MTSDKAQGAFNASADSIQSESGNHEHTLAGRLIGSVRDQIFGKANPNDAASRARSNDTIAELVADTVAMLPGMRYFTAGAVRAGLLYDTNADLKTGALSFGKNFAEGVALHGVTRLTGKMTGLTGLAEGETLSPSLLSQAKGGFGFGFGMSAVKTGFDGNSWQKDGQFSLSAGLENIGKAGAIGGAVGVPAGLLGGQVAKFGANAAMESGLSGRVVSASIGMGSGYAAGAVFGGVDAAMNGGGVKDIFARANESGLIGAATGGITGSVMRAEVPMREQPAQREAGSPGYANSSRAAWTSIEQPTPAAERINAAAGPESTSLQGKHSTSHLDSAVDRLTITRTQRSLADDVQAIGTYDDSTMTLGRFRPEMADKIKDFKSESQFIREAIAPEQVPVRVYHAGQNDLIIPHEYATQLDQVMALRMQAAATGVPEGTTATLAEYRAAAKTELAAHPYANRAHPADLLPVLEELPDRTLAKRVILLDSNNPDDAWHSATYRPNFVSLATASKEGTITFYKAKLNDGLFKTGAHEWGHLLKWAAVPESDAFDHATSIDKAFFISEYAKRNEHENWAEHTQAIIGSDFDPFWQTAEEAPIRASLIGRAISKAMKVVAPEQRSEFHQTLQDRAELLESSFVPKAQTILEETLQSRDPQERIAAAKVLRVLGSDKQMELLKNVAKTDSNADVRQAAFDAVRERTFYGDATPVTYKYYGPLNTKDAQIDFLVDMAQKGSRSRDLALQHLEPMLGDRASSWYQLLTIDQYRGEKLGRLFRIMEQMPDKEGKLEAWRQSQVEVGNDADRRVELAYSVFKKVPALREQALDVLISQAQPRTLTFLEAVANQAPEPLATRARAGVQRAQTRSLIQNLDSGRGAQGEEQRITSIQALAGSHQYEAIPAILKRYAFGTTAERAAAAEALDSWEHNVVKMYAQQMMRDDPRYAPMLKPVVTHNRASELINAWHNRPA